MLQDRAFAWQTGSSPAPKAQGDCARRLGPHKRTVLRLRQGFKTNLGLRRAAQRWKFVGKDASIDCSLTFQTCVAKYLAHPAVRIRQRASGVTSAFRRSSSTPLHPLPLPDLPRPLLGPAPSWLPARAVPSLPEVLGSPAPNTARLSRLRQEPAPKDSEVKALAGLAKPNLCLSWGFAVR